MGKIVYNACYGGFGLSHKAEVRYRELSGDPNAERPDIWAIERDDPILVRVVEELGEEANDSFSDLQIVDLPAGALWRIDEYDGNESVKTMNDYNWKVSR